MYNSPPGLVSFIRQQIIKEESKDAIFDVACQKFPAEINCTYPDCFHNDPEKLATTTDCLHHRLITEIILKEQEKYKQAVEEQKCPNSWTCNFKMMLKRYSLESVDFRGQKKLLYLYDNAYNIKKRLVLNHQIDEDSKILPINDDHFLLVQNTTIYLFQLDPASGECSMLDEHEIHNFQPKKCIVDMRNRNKFVIQPEDLWFASTVYKCEIKDGKLEVNKVSQVRLRMIETSIKYENEKLCYLSLEHGKKVGCDVLFYQLALNPKSASAKQVCSISEEIEHKINSFFPEKIGAWRDNSLYLLFKDNNRILNFDVNAKRVTEIAIKEHSICDFIVHEDSLFIATINKETNIHDVKTILAPQRLVDLATKSIGLQLMFTAKKDQYLLVKDLPPRLRFFGQ